MKLQQKKQIEIKLKSYCRTTLDIYLSILKNRLVNQGIKFSFINLPIKKRRLTLLRSPHVFKEAKEQFESRLHSSFLKIDLSEINNSFLIETKLKALILNKPKSILIKIKI